MPTIPLDSLPIATDETFDEELYLLANPDIAPFVQGGGSAREHFERYGRSEGRRQGLPLTVPRRTRKYARFAEILDPARGDGGAFRFVEDEGAFPVFYGDRAYDLGDYADESAHPGLHEFIVEIERNPDGLYLDIGCGRRNYTYDNCLYLEVYPSVSADIIMQPACRYPIASDSIDGIGCFAVLEHVTEPWLAAEEFRRILKPGGLLFIDWPFLQPVHGYPSHFYNATRFGLQRMFDEGFEQLTLDTLQNQTPDYTLTWILRSLSDALTDPAAREALLGMTVGDLLAQPPRSDFWMRIDAATPPETTLELACGNTLIARKL